MKAALLPRWILCIILVVVSGGCDQGPPPDRLRQGQLFPPLTLTGIDRPNLVLDDLHGRVVLLNVWATWCAACRAELGSLQNLSQVFAADELQVIGLSVDNDEHVAREFIRETGLTFANYIDREGEIAERILGIRVYPDTFIISQDGKLLLSIAGERQWDSPDMIAQLRAFIHRREL